MIAVRIYLYTFQKSWVANSASSVFSEVGALSAP